MAGIYGWPSSTTIYGFGTIFFNSDLCPKATPGGEGGENGENGENGGVSGNWWEQDKSGTDSSEDQKSFINWVKSEEKNAEDYLLFTAMIVGIFAVICCPVVTPSIVMILIGVVTLPLGITAAAIAFIVLLVSMIFKKSPCCKIFRKKKPSKTKRWQRKNKDPAIGIEGTDENTDVDPDNEKQLAKIVDSYNDIINHSKKQNEIDRESVGTVPGRDTWYGVPTAPKSIDDHILA